MEEDDFNDSPAGAGLNGFVLTGNFGFGDIEAVGDRDVFLTPLIAGLTYTIEQRGLSSGNGSLRDPHLFLVDAADVVLASNDDGETGLDSLIIHTATFTGAHFLSAREFADNEFGDYVVTVSAGFGTEAAEAIEATAEADAIETLGGGDSVRGLGGSDDIGGGDGGDSLYGGGSGDLLDGGRGRDQLFGGGGGDSLVGGRGPDVLRGGGGDDLLRGGFDADVLIGGEGDDLFQFISLRASGPRDRDRLVAGNGGDAFDNAGAALGDVFDLTSIDADVTRGGFQEFRFGGTSRDGRGFVSLENDGRDTILRLNVDEDGRAEFALVIEDGRSVRASDYSVDDFLTGMTM